MTMAKNMKGLSYLWLMEQPKTLQGLLEILLLLDNLKKKKTASRTPTNELEQASLTNSTKL